MSDAASNGRASRPGRAIATAAVLIALVAALNASARQQVMTAPHEAGQLASFVLSGDALAAAGDIGRPGSGEEDLPDDVLTMLALVRSHGVRAVSLSPKIAANGLWVQRLTESAFPIRITAHAPDRLAPDRLAPDRLASDRLALVGERLPRGCRPVAIDHGVALARCA